ncbi:MAG: serine/threonine-protein kinase, partial [Verrucomicrobiota bacterium]
MTIDATKDTTRISGAGIANDPRFPEITGHEMLRCIGSGAFGEVWLARNIMGTYRAVKVVHRRTFEHEHSYEREFTGMKKFEPVSRSHDGLVDILQVGRNDQAGYYYYVMELGDDQVSGDQFIPETYDPKTLGKEVASRGKLPFDECVKVGSSLAAALSHLHKHGLIHRDIKPSNIIFVNRIPKVADIGLVAHVGTSNTIIGTLGFMPPEGPGTPQGDIYSLGKVLYEISTGKDRQEWPELPTQLGETSGQKELLELNEVIVKACESDVRKRYKSADEMHADLMLLQAGKSVRRLRVLEQRFALATRIGAVVAALMLIGIGAFYQAKQAEKVANRRLAETYIANGNRSIDDGDVSRALPWFAGALRLFEKDTHNNELQRIRVAGVLRECPKTVQVLVGTNVLDSADISTNGQYLVTAGIDPAVTLWDATKGTPIRQLIGHTKEVEYASFSPDGRLIVTASDDKTVRIWESETGTLVRVIVHPEIVYSARFSPDGAWIITACKDGVVRLWEVRTLRAKEFAAHKQAVRRAAFSPDGHYIVTASEDYTAQVWNATTFRPVRGPFHHDSWVYDASFSPDSQLVVTASFDGTARVWNVRTGMLIHTLAHNDNVRSAQFSPDGRYVITACWDYMARVWDISNSKAVLVVPPLRHTGPVVQAGFSAQGRRVMTASN